MLIAHDLGTSGNKASLHSETGEMLDSVTVKYSVRFGPGGMAEQDAEDWRDAVLTATERLLGANPDARSRIKGIAISGQMMGAVFLDKRDVPVRPAMIWADARSYSQVDQVLQWRRQEEFYGITGNRMSVAYTLPKVMWVRDNDPEAWRRVRRVCWAKDYVTLCLTGRFCTDHSDASGSDCYNLETGDWDREILAEAGIDVSLLPEILDSTSIAGTLIPSVSSRLGLPDDVMVVVGGGDGPISAVGAGSVKPGDAPYVCLGTSSWIAVASETPAFDPQMRLLNFRHVVPGLFVPTATMQTGGAVMPWITDIVSKSSPDIDALMQEAKDVPAAVDGLFFLPYLLGERSPRFDPDASGAFVGLRMHHERGQLVKAAMEGVGFNLGLCLDAMSDCGIQIDEIEAIGGGAVGDTWLQILADIWGIPVHRRTIVSEANSLGAAVTAAVGLGLIDDFHDVRSLSKITATFEPTTATHEKYQESLELFDSAYRQLEPWFKESSAVQRASL